MDNLHDLLHAYYKVARKRFVDYLCMQVADYHLVNGPESPLLVFDPSFVGKLSPEKLRLIAGEQETIRWKRDCLKQEIEKFEKAKKILM